MAMPQWHVGFDMKLSQPNKLSRPKFNFKVGVYSYIFSGGLLFRPHLWGEKLYTQMCFFVQTILADRYIHRREVRVASLKNSSSVKFEIKKIFSNFVFFEELSWFKVSCEHGYLSHFCSLIP